MAAWRLVMTWVLLGAPCAFGQGAQLDLANYRHVRTHALFVSEASAVTYNADRSSLFVIGDGADMIVEFNRFGTGLSMVFLSGFEDTEGIGYIGDGQFVIAEERVQGVCLLTWPTSTTPIPTISRDSLPRVTLGPNVGNEGIEGICFDPDTDGYFAVKEKNPQRVLNVSIDFESEVASIAEQFPPGPLGVSDIADIAVVTGVDRLINSPDQDNLLIISQASSRLLEVNREGVIQSTFSLSGISGTAEGVTIDEQGVIYIVDETPQLYVLEPCRANFDWINGVEVSDIFAYLSAWFASSQEADLNGGGVNVDDIFVFLGFWFAGC